MFSASAQAGSSPFPSSLPPSSATVGGSTSASTRPLPSHERDSGQDEEEIDELDELDEDKSMAESNPPGETGARAVAATTTTAPTMDSFKAMRALTDAAMGSAPHSASPLVPSPTPLAPTPVPAASVAPPAPATAAHQPATTSTSTPNTPAPVTTQSSTFQVDKPNGTATKDHRTTHACTRCRKQKMKCMRPTNDPPLSPNSAAREPNQDPCRGCKAANVPCVFEGPRPRTKWAGQGAKGMSTPASKSESTTHSPIFPSPSVINSSGMMSGGGGMSGGRARYNPYAMGSSYGHGSSDGGNGGGFSATDAASILDRIRAVEEEVTSINKWRRSLPAGSGIGADKASVDNSSSLLGGGEPTALNHLAIAAQAQMGALAAVSPGGSSHHIEHSGSFGSASGPASGLAQAAAAAFGPSSSIRHSLQVPDIEKKPFPSAAEPIRRPSNDSSAVDDPSLPRKRQRQDSGSLSTSSSNTSPFTSDLLSAQIISTKQALTAVEFYISDLALHTPYIPFLPSPTTAEELEGLRHASGFLFDAVVIVGMRALDEELWKKSRDYFLGKLGQVLKISGEGVGREDVRGLLIFSIWHSDFQTLALAVQFAHQLGLHQALKKYRKVEDVTSPQAASLFSSARLYAMLFIHDHILQVCNGLQPITRSSILRPWIECLKRSPENTGVDSYIAAYLEFCDLLSDAQEKLIGKGADEFDQPVLTAVDTPESRRVDVAKRLYSKFGEWNRKHEAQQNLITSLPLFFSTVICFSPLSSDTAAVHPTAKVSEAGQQINEATDKADVLLTMLLQEWKERPMLSYTADLHHAIIGMSLAHIIWRLEHAIQVDDRKSCELLRHRLKMCLDTLGRFGFKTENSNLASITLSLSGKTSFPTPEVARLAVRGREDRKDMKRLSWGRELWNFISPPK